MCGSRQPGPRQNMAWSLLLATLWSSGKVQGLWLHLGGKTCSSDDGQKQGETSGPGKSGLLGLLCSPFRWCHKTIPTSPVLSCRGRDPQMLSHGPRGGITHSEEDAQSRQHGRENVRTSGWLYFLLTTSTVFPVSRHVVGEGAQDGLNVQVWSWPCGYWAGRCRLYMSNWDTMYKGLWKRRRRALRGSHRKETRPRLGSHHHLRKTTLAAATWRWAGQLESYPVHPGEPCGKSISGGNGENWTERGDL